MAELPPEEEFSPQYHEDTTDYLAGASEAVMRERQIVAQRRQQDRVIASLDAQSASADDYASAVAAKQEEDKATNLMSFAIQTVVAAGTFSDFDQLMDQSQKLYNLLTTQGQEEAAGAAQEAPEQPA